MADDSRPKPNKNRLIIKLKTIMDKNKTIPPLSQTTVMRCCSNCEFYRHEEVGDSDYGAVYAKEASCSQYYDTDEETEEDIPNFDRNIERECCVLDFFQVCEIDLELSEKLSAEMDKTGGSFNETYKLFKSRYNNA